MPKAIVIVLLYIVFFGSVACLTLPLGKFRSFEEKTAMQRLPISETDPGLSVQYHSEVYILHGQLIASESDYFVAGPYECTFGRVVVHPISIPGIAGYMPVLGLLQWNGEWYLNPTQLQLLLFLLVAGIMLRELYRRGWFPGVVHQERGNP